MKKNDIYLVVIAVVISGIIALVVSNNIFVTPKSRQQQVQVVQPITSDFPPPDGRFFNSQSYDPTQLIQIGPNSNTNPFNPNSSQQ